MRVLLVHSDNRPFEVERFGAAWVRGGGARGELVPATPATWSRDPAAGFDGLILTGGPDVEPARYGADPEPGVKLDLDPARDALDLELLHRAEQRRVPVLAVCYGMQVLNVHHGGSLIQDLERAGVAGHQVKEPKDFLAHTVRIASDSAHLAGLPESFAVNSRHHQGIATVGDGLRPSAVAPDGIVEALEPAGRNRFVLGVQWHPENIAAAEHDQVFKRFRAAVLGSPR